jgi:signal peptidase I
MQQSVETNVSEVRLPATGVVSAPQKKRSGSLVALVVFFAFALFVYTNFRFAVVQGVSMLPTFKSGQRLTVSNAYWLIGPIKDGDILILRDDYKDNKTGYIVKRVYKMAGEEVDMANTPHSWNIANGKYIVPEGELYVLGDNIHNSEDSRFIGSVPLTKVLGKVIIRP